MPQRSCWMHWLIISVWGIWIYEIAIRLTNCGSAVRCPRDLFGERVPLVDCFLLHKIRFRWTG
ncbi:hypothetical protein [Acinetobacter baumannii]|uniref:hypothetical protein n=1 Tax=Acinetobacter baumannii TaxID=470 RepID=UPI001140A12C|nr:hypothetical protein [Acinetobacter baumannii]